MRYVVVLSDEKTSLWRSGIGLNHFSNAEIHENGSVFISIRSQKYNLWEIIDKNKCTELLEITVS